MEDQSTSTHRYEPGEIVDLTIRGARIHAVTRSALEVELATYDVAGLPVSVTTTTIPIAARGVDVERVAPAGSSTAVGGAGGDQAACPHPLAELLVALGILIGKGLPAPWSINGTSLAWPDYAATMQLLSVGDVDAWATHHGAPATDQGEPYIANQSKPWVQYGATCMVAGQAVNVWSRRNLESAELLARNPEGLGGQS